MPLYEGLGFSPMGLTQDKNCIVIEMGYAFTRIGFVNELAPRAIIPTHAFVCPGKEAVPLMGLKGKDLTRGLWLFMETAYFRHLAVNPKERRIIIAESILWPIHFRRELARVLFSEFDIPGLLFVPQHLMALNCLALSSGLVVDFGYKEVISYPISNGITILEAVTTVPLGASAFHERLAKELLENDETHLRIPQESGDPVTEKITRDYLPASILEDIKCKACFIPPLVRGLQLAKEKIGITPVDPSGITGPPPDVEYQMEGSKILLVPGSVREKSGEIMFEFYGQESNVTSSILDAIHKSPIDLRKTLASNILIIGGHSMLPGLKARIQEELSRMVETEYKDKIHFSDFKFHSLPCNENYASWLGSAIYGSSEMLALKAISRAQYLESKILPFDWSNWYPQSG